MAPVVRPGRDSCSATSGVLHCGHEGHSAVAQSRTQVAAAGEPWLARNGVPAAEHGSRALSVRRQLRREDAQPRQVASGRRSGDDCPTPRPTPHVTFAYVGAGQRPYALAVCLLHDVTPRASWPGPEPGVPAGRFRLMRRPAELRLALDQAGRAGSRVPLAGSGRPRRS